MKYSLITDNRANSESFSTLKNAITELYPDFSFEKTVRAEGESETAIYARGDQRICAELNYGTREVRVSSDIPVPELAKYFKLSGTAAKKEYAQDRIKLLRLRHPHLWKYVIIPAILLLASTIICIIATLPYFGSDTLFFPIILSVEAVCTCAPVLGWIWFIPVLPAAIAAACFKKEKLYKLIVTAMPLVGAIRLCIFYPDICRSIYKEIPYIPTFLLLAVFTYFAIVIVFLILYVIALPYMITDDIAGAVCEHCGGKRPRKLFSALCWTVSIIVSIAAVCISGHFADIEHKKDTAELTAVRDEERAERSLEYDRIYEKYGTDIIGVAEYSVEHRYYDWYNCPDPVMKPAWERLFMSEYADSSLTYNEEWGYVKISLDDSFNYYVYPETNEIHYDNGTIISYVR